MGSVARPQRAGLAPSPAAAPGAAGSDRERLHDVVPGRLRRVALSYLAVVAAVAAIGGLFVEGERAFLVAWIYTGGALALPALLVTWMVARRELGSMPGGTAWCAGLVWIYVDGLGLLYITARPDTPLRTLSLAAVVPPIVLLGGGGARARPPAGRRRSPRERWSGSRRWPWSSWPRSWWWWPGRR